MSLELTLQQTFPLQNPTMTYSFSIDRLSRRSLFALLSAIPLMASFPASAELYNEMRHGDWYSCIVSGEGRVVGRAAVISGSEFFVIDFPDLESYEAKIITPIGEDNTAKNAYIGKYKNEIRVDRRTLFRLNSTVTQEGRVYFTVFDESLGYKFLEELRSGTMLRVRTFLSDGDSINRYSLKGSSAAINRAYRLLKDYRNCKNSESGYFSDSTSDSDYF